MARLDVQNAVTLCRSTSLLHLIVQVPADGAGDSLVQTTSCFEAEQCFCFCCVETTPRLAIRLGSVPCDTATKTHLLSNHLNQFSDGNFFSGPYVDGVAAVVFFRCFDDSLGSIFDIR